MLYDGEWTLRYPGTEISFGTAAHTVFHRTTPDFGDVEITVDDKDRPRTDGRAFGVDTRGGRTISFDLGVHAETPAAVRAEVAVLSAAWRADAVRRTPGAVAELVFQYDGRERVVYGRPRRFAPDYSDITVNALATVIADFACVDDLFYSLEYETATMRTVPDLGGGLLAPLASPLTTTTSSDRSAAITVETELPAWPVITIHGPITNPVVEIVGVFRVEVRETLAYDDVLVIDARPWRRTAILNGNGSLGGSVRGTRLSQVGIPTGTHEIVLRGLDATGTARASVQWGKTFPTP